MPCEFLLVDVSLLDASYCLVGIRVCSANARIVSGCVRHNFGKVAQLFPCILIVVHFLGNVQTFFDISAFKYIDVGLR